MLFFLEIFNTLTDDFSYSKITPEEITSIKEKIWAGFCLSNMACTSGAIENFHKGGSGSVSSISKL